MGGLPTSIGQRCMLFPSITIITSMIGIASRCFPHHSFTQFFP
ncbi:hypothetical protein L581_0175 [Serratia fonticola AU-AP2C]|nr:hypothetical protein L581_0175 [Serratia fonticola AU-AP2C]